MLKMMMDLKGPIPKRMIRKGLFASQHFASASSHLVRLNLKKVHQPPTASIWCFKLSSHFARILWRDVSFSSRAPCTVNLTRVCR
jgi:hypothetical protein